MKKPDVTILSTADWDNPFWTNKQHVAVQLSSLGHQVLYIDSLGLRRPSISRQDGRRVLRRLRMGFRGPVQIGQNMWRWSPAVFPLQSNSLVRAVNRQILGHSIDRYLRLLGMKPDILWTYNPITTQLLDTSSFDAVVYHCVDEIKAQPGMPTVAIESYEKELSESASIIFATSPLLAETRSLWNANTHYFANVADYDHFSRAMDDSVLIPPDLQEIPGPRIVFIGAITPYKMDIQLLSTAARARRDWSFILIGKVGEGDPGADVSGLEAEPNIHLIGPRAYGELPRYLRGCDVGILPAAMNDYTAAMFPMKFFEYLAAGLPVVSTALPALIGHSDVAHIASSPQQFISLIEAALNGDGPGLPKRLDRARQFTYESRMKDMMEALYDSVPRLAEGTT